MTATLVLLCLLPGDWPHVRGPGYDGLSAETGLADAWPEGGPPVLWVRDLGQGYSGIIAVAGRVYTMFQSRTGTYVVALDADTGAERWRQRVDWPWRPAGAYPGPFATPTWHAGRIYYTTPTGLAGCLDADRGASRWSVNVRTTFRGRGTEFGYAATPLVEDGRVILPVGGRGASLVALNADDGSTAWAAGDGPASYCPAYPITVRGRRLIVAFLQNSLALHDAATGKRLWQHELSSDYDEHSAWPLYVEPHLLISSPFKLGAQVFRLEAQGDGPSVTQVLANVALSNDVCSSVVLDGKVYGFDLHQAQASPHRASRGAFKCLELTTGRARWETDRVGQATVLVADGKLILLNDTGTLILARATPRSYDELARHRVLDGGLCWTPPALHRGRLYVRNQKRLVCLHLGPPGDVGPGPVTTPTTAGEPFDWSVLLPREPDYPHDAPSAGELARWFAWCVALFAAAGVVAGVAWLVTRRMAWAVGAFTAVAFLLGLVGTTAFSAWSGTFVLTWPAALYVAFRLLLAAGAWASRPEATWRARLLARLALVAFLVLCYGYYLLCLAVGYVMAWGFLAGLLPAAPLAVIASRGRAVWLRGTADAIGFAVYFWLSGLLPGWKEQLFG